MQLKTWSMLWCLEKCSPVLLQDVPHSEVSAAFPASLLLLSSAALLKLLCRSLWNFILICHNPPQWIRPRRSPPDAPAVCLSRRETVLRRERAAEVFCCALIRYLVVVCLNKELLLFNRDKSAGQCVRKAEKVLFQKLDLMSMTSSVCIAHSRLFCCENAP